MVRKTLLLGSALLAGTAMLFAQAPARAAVGVETGLLRCDVDSGWGYLLGSSRTVRCSYVSNYGGIEEYVGSMSKIGVDLGYTNGGRMIWSVIAPTAEIGPGALAGEYGGGTAGVTLGYGFGAHALIGGFRRSIALQPLSVEGNSGINVAGGLALLDLRFAGSGPAPIPPSPIPPPLPPR
jgi:hypothetical protein